VELRATTAADLKFVVAAEQAEQHSGFIGCWSREEHIQAIGCDNFAHFVVERRCDRHPVGYLIFQDVQSPHQTVQLRRIVIAQKGQGYGRAALRQAKRLAFETYGAYRFWLDVKSHNDRAQALYRSEGFVLEGVLRDCIVIPASAPADIGSPSGSQQRRSLQIMSILRPEYDRLHP